MADTLIDYNHPANLSEAMVIIRSLKREMDILYKRLSEKGDIPGGLIRRANSLFEQYVFYNKQLSKEDFELMERAITFGEAIVRCNNRFSVLTKELNELKTRVEGDPCA